MNRIDRLTAILIQLQTKRVVKAQEIADRFNISLRTVYRDIRALEEAGIPIGSEAGLGYYLVEGYHLPPVMLDKDEAGALLVSQKLVEKFTDASIAQHIDSAMYKIRSVLKETDKDYLQNLDSTIQVYNSLSQSHQHDSIDYMSQLQQAISSKRKIEIEYTNLLKKSSTRILEPLGMIFYATHWHIIAWCNLRDDYRDFRIDRITSLEILNQKFFETDHPSLDEYLKKMEDSFELTEAKIQIVNQVVPYISVQKFHHGFIQEVDLGSNTEMTFMVSDWEYFTRWLLSLGNAVTIVSPDQLNNKMLLLVKELTAHYC